MIQPRSTLHTHNPLTLVLTSRRSGLTGPGYALAASLVLSTLFSTGCGDARATTVAKEEEPIRVTAASVESRSLPKRLAVTGALVADETADIAAERDGRVARIEVERGSFVEKGAVLAVLDDREAKAQLDEARANVAWSRSELSRYAELRDKGVVAKAERQRKEVDVDLVSARLSMAEKAFDDCIIRAPFAGLVSERKAAVGSFVRRGQAVAGLVRIEPLRAELSIPESAVSAVKVGQVVRLSAQAYPDRVIDGKIAYIGPSLRSEARTLVVEARVPNQDRSLKPGLFVTAQIDLPASSLAVLAPVAAIVTEAGISRAFVLGGERVSERLVTLGERYGDLVEVHSGLASGDRVVLRPDRRLADGLQIIR